MLKRLKSACAALLLVLATAGIGAEVVEQVLVKVNGDIITKLEFEERQVTALRSRPEFANASPSSGELQKAIATLTPELILSAVDELLLVQRGRDLGYTLGDEQFKQIVDNIRKENNLEDETRFVAALKQEGMTLADLRKSLEKQMLVSRVQSVDVMDKISVTEEESKTYYAAHRQEFVTPSQVTLREILIEVPASDRGVNVAQDDEARQKAEELRKRLVAGEPFPRLASEFSASASKTNGGLIGPLSYDELAPALQKLVDGMKAGDIAEPMRTTRGYQLWKLETRTETKVRNFEEARDDISRRVAEQKARGELLKYIERLREQATITWRNDELKKAYESAIARRRDAIATPGAPAPPASPAAGTPAS